MHKRIRSSRLGTAIYSKGRSGIRFFVTLEELFDYGFVAAAGWAVIGFVDAEVFLIDFGVGMIVGVFVSLALVELLGPGVITAAEMSRNGYGSIILDVGEGGPNGHSGGIGFFSGGQVDNGLGEWQLGFGKADKIGGVEGAGGNKEGLGVGVSDVLGGKNDHSSSDETQIFTGVDHSSQPIDCGIGVGTAHGFYEGGDNVVVLISVAVVVEGFALNGFDGDMEIKDERFSGCGGLGEDADLQGGQGPSGVAV